MHTASVIAIALATSWLPASGLCAEPGAGAGYVPPAYSYIPETRYPENEYIEALVFVRFVVNEEGIPVEVKVLEDQGFHRGKFRYEALEHVKRVRFKPATRDGVPVKAGPVTIRVRFRQPGFDGAEGVRGEFRSELRKVEKLRQEKDYAGANVHAEWMLREKTTLQYEYLVLKAQLAQTSFEVGNHEAALQAAMEASRSNVSAAPLSLSNLRQPVPENKQSNYVLPRETVLYLLNLRMQLQVQSGQVVQALETYYELAGLEGKLKADDPRVEIADKLMTLLESGRPLSFKGAIRDEYWDHKLIYPRYTLRNVTGQLHQMHLHCREHYLESEYSGVAVWSVPEGAEDCTVEFFGDADSTFELVELPADD